MEIGGLFGLQWVSILAVGCAGAALISFGVFNVVRRRRDKMLEDEEHKLGLR